jgi:hypothetical protein
MGVIGGRELKLRMLNHSPQSFCYVNPNHQALRGRSENMENKCMFCKKELGNKNIIEIDYHKKVIWSDDKEIIVESSGGGRYYAHNICFRNLIKRGKKYIKKTKSPSGRLK